MDSNSVLLLADSKIKVLEEYNRITQQIAFEETEPELINVLLEDRQALLDELVRINLDIADAVKLCDNPQAAEELIISFKGLDGEPPEGMEELYAKGDRIKGLTATIKRVDRKIGEKLEALKAELTALMSETGKKKKVIDYFSQTTVDISKGGKLNGAS